jgi:tagatose-1,6-bisphosphate aldolase
MTVGPTKAPDAVAGRRRRLLRLGGTDGVVAGIAIDHRDSLRVALEHRGLTDLTSADLGDLKLRLARTFAPAATAIMLDAELGGATLQAGVIPSRVGLIMPLEAQGYESGGDDRTTALLPDFPAEAAHRYGADACKVLLPYRVDRESQAAQQDALVASTAAACHALGLPLVIEPVVYRLSSDREAEYAEAYTDLVIRAVTRLQPLGADLLKLPFPILDPAGAAEPDALAACRALDRACSGTPWVLLGAGVDTATFLEEIRIAGTAGAAGFLAGRGIWGPTLARDPDEVERLAIHTGLPDFERCRATAERHARPLTGSRPD